MLNSGLRFADADSTHAVFVYGTLKPGECNYGPYCERYVIDWYPAIAYGQLFDLPMGYPAMTDGSQVVQGMVLGFNTPSILRVLDELEDYDPARLPEENEYERRKIDVFSIENRPLGQAWSYLMMMDQIKRLGGVPIRDGCWRSTPVSPPSIAVATQLRTETFLWGGEAAPQKRPNPSG